MLPFYGSTGAHDKYSLFYSYADNVNIRSTPDLGGKVAGRLSLGDSFFILERNSGISTINGYSDHWYKIRVNDPAAGIPLQGYVWGGYIANQHFFIDVNNDGADELLLLRNFTEGVYSERSGLANSRTAGDDNFTLKIVFADKKFREIKLPCPGECGIAAIKLIEPAGFDENFRFLLVSYGCSGESSGVYDNLYLANRDLARVFSLYSSSEGGDSVDYDIIFPGDSGGRPGCIIIKSSESTSGSGNVTVKFMEYRWSEPGKKFIENVYEP